MSSKQGGSGVASAWVTEVSCSLAEKGPVINNKDRGGGGGDYKTAGEGDKSSFITTKTGGGRFRIVLAMLKGSGGEQRFGVVLTHELEV